MKIFRMSHEVLAIPARFERATYRLGIRERGLPKNKLLCIQTSHAYLTFEPNLRSAALTVIACEMRVNRYL